MEGFLGLLSGSSGREGQGEKALGKGGMEGPEMEG